MRYHVCQFSGKTNKFKFLGPNFLENNFWGRNFKYLNSYQDSAPPRQQVCQFSVKTDNFEFFSLNLGISCNYMWYFGSDKVDKNWMKAEMSSVEVDEAGWKCVHGLVISNFTRFFNFRKKLSETYRIIWRKSSIINPITDTSKWRRGRWFNGTIPRDLAVFLDLGTPDQLSWVFFRQSNQAQNFL